MQFTAAQIGLLINGKVEGDASVTVQSFGKIEEAKASQISFLANPKYEDFIYTTSASIVIVNDSLQLKKPVGATLIRVPDAYSAFAILMTKYQEMAASQLSGIQDLSYVAQSAQLGNNVFIGAFAYVDEDVKIGNNTKIHPGVYLGKNVVIGDNTTLFPGVKIYTGCVVGNQVIIHAGSVIGSDGFGFAPQADGTFQKVPQLGNVVIEDYVEIGANSTIDRATMGSTLIRKGVKIDNLVQIAHNVEVGNNTVIAAQTGISGSSKIGKYVMMGGQTGVAGHLSIADGTKIGGKSGITKTIKEPNKSVNGIPAFDYTSSLRVQAATRNLPEMEKRIKALEKMVSELVSEKLKP
ncbi:MAG: UDP-3-O-(3-hydroxymyristoyl)glucosamine N-acyltransferase [Bacteroidota bacterium]|jgi:UDP-3-O-[3-hydroxymyristoyl] glucosamine N-acyltransferase